MPDQNTATRLLSVIDGAIEKGTRSGAGIEVTYGQVFGLTGGMEASVYLAGARELSESEGGDPEPSEGYRVPAHFAVHSSDYVRVAIDSRGHRWIEEVIPTTPYPKISIDVEGGDILVGDGTVAPIPAGVGGGTISSVVVKEDGVNKLVGATALDFTTGLDASDAGSGRAVIAVDPSEIKLDDLGTPDDNTDLNVSMSRHGLMPKGTGATDTFYRSDGTQAAVVALPTSYYKPVGANYPGAITTDGTPEWLPLATSDGDIVMVEILL